MNPATGPAASPTPMTTTNEMIATKTFINHAPVRALPGPQIATPE